MFRFLRYVVFLCVLFCVGKVFAAGYTCPTEIQYSSCNPGYYMTKSSSSTECYPEPVAGNACRPCSVYSNTAECAGGTTCPSSNLIQCSPGNYLPPNVTKCTPCGGANYYCPGGSFPKASVEQGRYTVDSGYYSTGGTSETTRTGQAQCTGATYCVNGVQNTCPINYQDDLSDGKSKMKDCKIMCDGGYRVLSAKGTCTAISSGNVYIGEHLVSYGSTSPEATACPTSYVIAGTTAADHDEVTDCRISCTAGTQVVLANGLCTTPTGSWYTTAHTVPAGSTSDTNVKSCRAGYSTNSTTDAADHDSSLDCKIYCDAGTRVTEAYGTCATPAGNWYVGGHALVQGSISAVNECLDNYTISGTAATNHDSEDDCKISCSGGSYLANINDTTCTNVGEGFWAAASSISQGKTGTRNACGSGLTTRGFGAAADEANDCGRVLNFDGEKIYLRKNKKTTPSLNVRINDTTYYGNMSTATKGRLRVKNGSITYSVYDDGM